jgi:hypothetical protein
LQMLTEIGAENNTTTLVMIPSDIISLAKEWSIAAHNNNATVATNRSPLVPQIAATAAPAANALEASNAEQQLNLPAATHTPEPGSGAAIDRLDR